MIDFFSTCKSPHAILGTLAKTYYAEKQGIDPLFYTIRERTPEERLPWAHIDCGISDKLANKSVWRPQVT